MAYIYRVHVRFGVVIVAPERENIKDFATKDEALDYLFTKLQENKNGHPLMGKNFEKLVGNEMVELDADHNVVFGYQNEDFSEDLYFIEKVPAVYSLLCVDQVNFDYSTDLVGNFNSLNEALETANKDIQETVHYIGWDTDDFNEEPKFEIVLNEIGKRIDYFAENDNLTWTIRMNTDNSLKAISFYELYHQKNG